MNFSINPINANSVSLPSLFASYRQAQSSAQNIASVVYQSLEYLTGSDDGLSLQDLEDLNQTLINENQTQSSAFTLVNTMINRFDALSSDGETITQADFTSTIKFAAAQNFSSNSAINAILEQSGVSVSDTVKQLFGSQNAQTLALVEFMDSLSEQTLGKILSNLNSSSDGLSRKIDNTSSKSENNAVQDFKNVTASQLKSPINISV